MANIDIKSTISLSSSATSFTYRYPSTGYKEEKVSDSAGSGTFYWYATCEFTCKFNNTDGHYYWTMSPISIYAKADPLGTTVDNYQYPKFNFSNNWSSKSYDGWTVTKGAIPQSSKDPLLIAKFVTGGASFIIDDTLEGSTKELKVVTDTGIYQCFIKTETLMPTTYKYMYITYYIDLNFTIEAKGRKKNQYTVKFSNDGSIVKTYKSVDEGASIQAPGITNKKPGTYKDEKDGKISYDSNGGSKCDSSKLTHTKLWEQQPHKYWYSGSKSIKEYDWFNVYEDATYTTKYEDINEREIFNPISKKITLPLTTLTGHIFNGWYDGNKIAGKNGEQYDISNLWDDNTNSWINKTLKANWTPWTATIQYVEDPNDNTVTNMPKDVDIKKYGTDLKLRGTTPRRSAKSASGSWNLIFDYNGGSGKTGKTTSISIETTKTTSYGFGGWKCSVDSTKLYKPGETFKYNPIRDGQIITMTTTWTDTTSEIAKGPINLKDIKDDIKPNKYIGANFLGWSTTSEPGGKIITSYKPSKNNEILYAQWDFIPNTLILHFYDADNIEKIYTKEYTIKDANFYIGAPQKDWILNDNKKYNPFPNDYEFLGWSNGDAIGGKEGENKWKDVKGLYFNVTEAPTNSILNFTPTKYTYDDYWGYDVSTEKYKGLSFNYYGCWTVSGKYIKLKDANNKSIWKKITTPYIKINGVWKVIVDTYVKINGVWKKEVGKN